MQAEKRSVDKADDSISFKDWRNWCRLCAKDDAQKVNFLLKDECLYTTTSGRVEEKELMLLRAIEKYFSVDIKEKQELPNRLCPECFSYIFSLVNFNNRVTKVQELFAKLQEWYGASEMDIRLLRMKYGILESDRPHEMTIPSWLSKETTLFETDHERDDNNKYKEKPGSDHAREWSEEPEIKMECLIDTTAINDYEDVCDIKHELNDGEDPFGSEHEVNNAVDKSGCSKASADENESKHKKVARKSIKANSKSGNKNLKSSAKKSVRTGDGSRESPECKYFCSECPQSFLRVRSYSLHLRQNHGITDIPKFTCSKCPRSFKHSFNLKRHMDTHRPPCEKKIFPCPQCDRKFQAKDYVATHIKFVHEDARPLICEECGEGVRTQGALREHMLTHTDYAPFECEICKKCFKNQLRLKKHMDIHSADKYVCAECGLHLNSRVTLSRHMLVHSDVMQHKCDYCGRAFKRAKTLKSHLILHSGMKPYSCQFCERRFTSGSNCRTHMKRKHPNELAELEATGEQIYTKNIPKLAVLKNAMKTSNNLKPVVSKQSGNFACRKKTLQNQDDRSSSTKNITTNESVETLAQKNLDEPS